MGERGARTCYVSLWVNEQERRKLERLARQVGGNRSEAMRLLIAQADRIEHRAMLDLGEKPAWMLETDDAL